MVAAIRKPDSSSIQEQLDGRGYARLGRLLTDRQADSLRSQFANDQKFRSHIVMRRHGYGEGEYKYFDYPLPNKVASLRDELYALLVPVANEWQENLLSEMRFPATHAEFLARCHRDGQLRPTPLILRYKSGDYNRLHQDLYGAHVFPLQVVVLLSDESDFTGGEFVLTEQRPRMQSRVEVVGLKKGHGVAFAVNERPQSGARGYYRVKMRHGVSELRSGERYTLGIILHDAA